MGQDEYLFGKDLAWEKSVSMLWDFNDGIERAVLESILGTLVGGFVPNLGLLSTSSPEEVKFVNADSLHALLHPRLFCRLGSPSTMPSGLVKVDLEIHLRVLQWVERQGSGLRNLEVARHAHASSLLIRLLQDLQDDLWPDPRAWDTRGGNMARAAYQKKVAQLLGRCAIQNLSYHTSGSSLRLLLHLLRHSSPSSWLQPLLAKLLTSSTHLCTSSLHPTLFTPRPQAWFELPSASRTNAQAPSLRISLPVVFTPCGFTFALQCRLESFPWEERGATGKPSRMKSGRKVPVGDMSAKEARLFFLQAIGKKKHGGVEACIGSEGEVILRSLEQEEAESGRDETRAKSGNWKETSVVNVSAKLSHLQLREWCWIVVTYEHQLQGTGHICLHVDEHLGCAAPFKLLEEFSGNAELVCQIAGVNTTNTTAASSSLRSDGAQFLDMQVGRFALFSSPTSPLDVLNMFEEIGKVRSVLPVCNGSTSSHDMW
eukprot:CAMPEP_0196573750 /NCGR_PEP_ID=MMETSP1081-20130531/3599_1 /TAXON_ID=36882 /ORGANISM="Pyramimonas amylifera, Strain CCMP720" /LENGTH=484 /DNA_ID=CAMNT_0041891573 /DNA_START=209 /DNA_END=1660 /DNA_ORIENTATION=+